MNPPPDLNNTDTNPPNLHDPNGLLKVDIPSTGTLPYRIKTPTNPPPRSREREREGEDYMHMHAFCSEGWGGGGKGARLGLDCLSEWKGVFFNEV